MSWNAGEDFPSLGIGHFIWYPAGYSGPFDESFPKFVSYARSRGVQVPSYFNGPAPWPNKAAFLADRSGRADAMRRWLAGHVQWGWDPASSSSLYEPSPLPSRLNGFSAGGAGPSQVISVHIRTCYLHGLLV